MSTIHSIDNLPVKIISMHASGLDVDVVSNKKCIVTGVSNTAGHVIVHVADTPLSSTRIMFGSSVAKRVESNGTTEVDLWGNNVSNFIITSRGLLVDVATYSGSGPTNDDVQDYLWITNGSKVYKWNNAAGKFLWSYDVGVSAVGIVVDPPRPSLLDGLLIGITNRTVDVDEDGPYMQRGVSLFAFDHFTQYSIFRETITTEYSASLIESLDCDAINIDLGSGRSSAEKYRQMTVLEGLEFVEQMRSIRDPSRSYAPTAATNVTGGHAITQKVAPLIADPQNPGKLISGTFVEIAGKESNYSLKNLVKRYDFIDGEQIDTIGLAVANPTYAAITQTGGSGRKYELGNVLVSSSGWGGMLTRSLPRIASYVPRFTHVQFNVTERTLTWQEQQIRSYALFNNFDPDVTTGDGLAKLTGPQPYGAGGSYLNPAIYDERVAGEEILGSPTDIPTVPWSS